MSEWIVCRCEKPSEIPARGIFAEPLGCKIDVLRTWSDKITAENINQLGANID